MKEVIIWVIVLALCLAICLVLSSCRSSAKNDDPNNHGAITLKPVDNLSDYIIVRGDLSSSEETELATRLRDAINTTTGASVAVKTDFSNSTYEILIGSTKRQQSIDAMKGLKYHDYTIKTTAVNPPLPTFFRNF